MGQITLTTTNKIATHSKKKGIDVEQEWIGALMGFAEVLSNDLNIELKDAFGLLPELIHQLKDPKVGEKFLNFPIDKS